MAYSRVKLTHAREKKKEPSPRKAGIPPTNGTRPPTPPPNAPSSATHLADDTSVHKLNSAISAYHEEILNQNEQLLETQVELEASRDRYAQLYDEAPVGYMALDRNGVIEEVNLTAVKLLGLERRGIIQRPLLVFIQRDDQPGFLKFLMTCRSEVGANKQWVEVKLKKTDGAFMPVLLSSISVRRDSGKGTSYLTAITDISGRVQLEEQRRAADERMTQAVKQRSLAEAANQAKDRFLAMLSHELRTPLTPALMRLSALAEAKSLSNELRDELRLIRTDIELEARLIDDLLDINRILHGKSEPCWEYLDLCEIVRRSLQICQPDIQTKGLAVTLLLPSKAIPIRGDAVRLQQVFWNILRNAIKFTAAGGQITVEASNASSKARVRIMDTGIGIEPEVLPRIYHAFEQGNVRFGGLGLGLAISKAIVDAHFGTIDARSAGKGDGTTFTVTLPLELNMPAASRAGKISSGNGASAAARVKPLRILLVEDHDVTRLAMAKLLADLGYEPHPAGTAEQALLMAANQPFDLVISDIGLPDRSGYELMAQLRREHGLQGIALSGFGMEQDQIRSQQAGFAKHLIKPVTIQTLQESIDSLACEIFPDKNTAS